MKARWLVGSAVLVGIALGGCRAIVGIEPTELQDAGAQGDGGGDGGKGDGATTGDGGGGGQDAQPEGGGACSGKSGGDCFKCCRDNDQQGNGLLEGYMKSTGCLCGASGGCATECANSTCKQPPGPPDTTCPQCIDGLLRGSTCTAAFDQCAADKMCKPALDCIQGCPP